MCTSGGAPGKGKHLPSASSPPSPVGRTACFRQGPGQARLMRVTPRGGGTPWEGSGGLDYPTEHSCLLTLTPLPTSGWVQTGKQTSTLLSHCIVCPFNTAAQCSPNVPRLHSPTHVHTRARTHTHARTKQMFQR